MAAVLRSGRTSAASRSISGPPAYSAASSSRVELASLPSSSSVGSSSAATSDSLFTSKARRIVRNAVRQAVGSGTLSTVLSSAAATRSATQTPRSPVSPLRQADPAHSPRSPTLSSTSALVNPPSYSRDNPGHIQLDALDVAATTINADLPTESTPEVTHDAVCSHYHLTQSLLALI